MSSRPRSARLTPTRFVAVGRPRLPVIRATAGKPAGTVSEAEVSATVRESFDALAGFVPAFDANERSHVTHDDRIYFTSGNVRYDGGWSVTLDLRECETGANLLLKAMRTKYLTGASVPMRFVREAWFQMLAGSDAPTVVAYGWGNAFLESLPGPDMLYILMERKEMSLETYLSMPDSASSIAEVRVLVRELYRRLGDKGLHVKDVSGGNVVLNRNPLRVFAIDFDPQDDAEGATYTGGAPVSEDAQRSMAEAVDEVFEPYV